MTKVIGVRFRQAGKVYFFSPGKLHVKQGDKVTAKQAIGTIYTDTNEDNKTELYFQLYKDRSILNPSQWLVQ